MSAFFCQQLSEPQPTLKMIGAGDNISISLSAHFQWSNQTNPYIMPKFRIDSNRVQPCRLFRLFKIGVLAMITSANIASNIHPHVAP